MTSSKTFLLLGLVFAVVVLIFSEVSARELPETTIPPIQNGGKGGRAVHCKDREKECYRHGGKGNLERGGEGDPAVGHGGKGELGKHCEGTYTNRVCHKYGGKGHGHDGGGKQDPIHKSLGHEHGGERDPINRGGKGPGHESRGTLDPIRRGGKGNKERPGQPGRPGTAETETKN